MNIKDVNKTGFMTKKELNEMNFEHIKNIIIYEINLMINNEFPQHKIDEINSGTIDAATKIYKFDKNQVNELKKLANLL